MVKSDVDAKEFSIFDLDNAPPPPPPGRRGVSRTLSPLQARRDAKNFSPIISGGKSTKEKVGRGRIWSTESIPGIKSIWSTEDTEKLPPPPPSRRSSATEGRPNTPIEWNSDRRLSLNIDSSRGPSRSFKPIVSHDNRRPSLKDMIRSLSPQPPPPPPPRIEDLSDNEGEASIRDLENAPSDNSLSFLHDGSSQPWMHRSGVLPDSTSSVQSDDRLTRMGNSSQTRKVSFGPNALPKTGSSRQGTLSSQLEAPDSDDGEATDYGYGDMEDGIGLSSSRSSGGVQSTIIRQRSESQNSTGNWSHNWSDHNPTECDPEDEAEHFESMTSQTMNARPPVVIAGISLPKWVPRLPTVNDISIKIVTYCFCSCLCGGVQQMTDRAILGRLNVLIGLLSIFPLGASTFLAVVLYAPFVNLDRDLPPQTTPFTHSHTVSESLWTLNGPMLLVGIFSFVSFSAAVFTWRVVRDVDLIGAIRYLVRITELVEKKDKAMYKSDSCFFAQWVLVWCLPFFIFAGISLFDRFNTTQVWVQNFWRSPQMAWIRRRNCHPSSVYNTLCTVPDVQNETQWCIDNYNSTECTSIRTSAEQSAVQSLVRYYAFTGVWVLCLFCIVSMETRYEDWMLVVFSNSSHTLLSGLITGTTCYPESREYNQQTISAEVERVQCSWVALTPLYGLLGTWRIFYLLTPVITECTYQEQRDHRLDPWTHVLGGGRLLFCRICTWMVHLERINSQHDGQAPQTWSSLPFYRRTVCPCLIAVCHMRNEHQIQCLPGGQPCD